jgi:hypothetical protein
MISCILADICRLIGGICGLHLQCRRLHTPEYNNLCCPRRENLRAQNSTEHFDNLNLQLRFPRIAFHWSVLTHYEIPSFSDQACYERRSSSSTCVLFVTVAPEQYRNTAVYCCHRLVYCNWMRSVLNIDKPKKIFLLKLIIPWREVWKPEKWSQSRRSLLGNVSVNTFSQQWISKKKLRY